MMSGRIFSRAEDAPRRTVDYIERRRWNAWAACGTEEGSSGRQTCRDSPVFGRIHRGDQDRPVSRM